jgi:hypothetical protein
LASATAAIVEPGIMKLVMLLGLALTAATVDVFVRLPRRLNLRAFKLS